MFTDEEIYKILEEGSLTDPNAKDMLDSFVAGGRLGLSNTVEQLRQADEFEKEKEDDAHPI